MYVQVRVPPLGFTTFEIVPSNSEPPLTVTYKFGDTFSVENEFIRMDFSSEHMLLSWTNKTSGNTNLIFHGYRLYKSVMGSAYLMRVSDPAQKIDMSRVVSHVTRGPLVSLVTTVVNENLNHTWKLFSGAEFAEITYMIDSLAEPGYNLITNFETEIKNGNNFYTDDSGWLLMKRQSTSRVEESYFPSVEFFFINSSQTEHGGYVEEGKRNRQVGREEERRGS
jgi:hypothetical protein